MTVVVVERPDGSYESTTTTTNSDKYGTDSTLENAISSGKVDGDINKLIDAINTIASYDATASYADLETAVQQVKTNQDAIAGLVAGTVPANSITTVELAPAAVENVNMADDSVGTDELIALSVTGAEIANTTITAGKFTTGAVDNAALGLNAVEANNITSGAVVETKIDAGAVTAAKLGTAAVTEDKIAANAVTAVKITDGAVTTAKLENDAVTADKLDTTGVTANSYTAADITVDENGRVTAASSNAPVDAQQLCKAWVNFNGQGTVSIRDSFNVSSITDNGTGRYTANLITAFADTNYVMVGTTMYTTTAPAGLLCRYDGAPKTTTTIAFKTSNSTNGSHQDQSEICLMLIGDQ